MKISAGRIYRIQNWSKKADALKFELLVVLCIGHNFSCVGSSDNKMMNIYPILYIVKPR